MTWVVDLDDQCDAWDALPYLLAIKEKFPKFKVTLFTIPGECSRPHLLKLKQYDWIELALHGWIHRINDEHSPLEMKDWGGTLTHSYLHMIEGWYSGIFAKGLKAPGWQISDDTYRVLIDREYWIMDQHYNDDRRPTGMRVYHLNEPGNIHGHTWDCNGGCDNSIERLIEEGAFDKITQEDDFKFVSEAVK
jgi:hypothetical protein